MILEIIIGILGLLVVILGYTTFNLLRKSEKAEDIIISQSDFIENLSSQILKSENRLNEIDEKGIFKIKQLQAKISQFKTNQE